MDLWHLKVNPRLNDGLLELCGPCRHIWGSSWM